MAEVQVLQRLCSEGIFPYMNRPPPSGTAVRQGADGYMQNMHVCFYMRRWVGILLCVCVLCCSE